MQFHVIWNQAQYNFYVQTQMQCVIWWYECLLSITVFNVWTLPLTAQYTFHRKCQDYVYAKWKYQSTMQNKVLFETWKQGKRK